MKYNLNKVSKAKLSPLLAFTIILGILVIFLLNVAYSCSETARDRLYPSIQVYEDGSFIMVNKDGSTKYGCLSGGLCQEDKL